MQTCAIKGGVATATSPVFGDGYPEPSDIDTPVMSDLSEDGEGRSAEAASVRPSRLKTAVVAAGLMFAMLAYLGLWAAIIGAILAGARTLLHMMGSSA